MAMSMPFALVTSSVSGRISEKFDDVLYGDEFRSKAFKLNQFKNMT